jgi:TonB family protein
VTRLQAVELKHRQAAASVPAGDENWGRDMIGKFAFRLPAAIALLALAPLASRADPPAPAVKTDPSFKPDTPTPAYPKASRKAKEAGTVKARLCIDHTGHITKADISQSSGYPNLDNAVLDWLRKVQLNPATENAKPVDVCDYPFHYEFVVTEHKQPKGPVQAGNPGAVSGTY